MLDYNLLNQDLTHRACITYIVESKTLQLSSQEQKGLQTSANTVSRLSLSHTQRLSVSLESWLMLLAPGSSVPSDRATEKCRTGECDRRKDIRTKTADERIKKLEVAEKEGETSIKIVDSMLMFWRNKPNYSRLGAWERCKDTVKWV